jgi:hypothetical protein
MLQDAISLRSAASATGPKHAKCLLVFRKGQTMRSSNRTLQALALFLGGILVGCQQTPPSNTVIVPEKTPAPQTTEKTTTQQTETKQTSPATTNPDGSTSPETTTTQKSTTVEKKQ